MSENVTFEQVEGFIKKLNHLLNGEVAISVTWDEPTRLSHCHRLAPENPTFKAVVNTHLSTWTFYSNEFYTLIDAIAQHYGLPLWIVRGPVDRDAVCGVVWAREPTLTGPWILTRPCEVENGEEWHSLETP